ncbi:unnamed protein product [Closterium sp. NIES-54]
MLSSTTSTRRPLKACVSCCAALLLALRTATGEGVLAPAATAVAAAAATPAVTAAAPGATGGVRGLS